VLYILANTLFAHLHELGAPEAPTGFLRPLLSVIAIFVLAKAACGFIAGWGLLQREPWARIIALVLVLLRCSTSPSVQPWAFTRYGSCCPRNRNKNMTPSSPLAPHKGVDASAIFSSGGEPASNRLRYCSGDLVNWNGQTRRPT